MYRNSRLLGLDIRFRAQVRRHSTEQRPDLRAGVSATSSGPSLRNPGVSGYLLLLESRPLKGDIGPYVIQMGCIRLHLSVSRCYVLSKLYLRTRYRLLISRAVLAITGW